MNTYSMIKKATALLFAVWSGGTSLVMAQQPGDMVTTDSSAGWKAKNYASVSGKDLEKTPVANLTNTLYGRLNGLMVAQNNGQPGYDQASMFMRGRGTYDQAAIVCYVDGFQVDISFYFQYLSAGEIENITLLKDPVTLATFGMKGANGILWVTTKRAKSGQFRVDAQMISGIQQAAKIQKPYGAYQYASLYNQAISNDGYAINGNRYQWTPAYNDASLQAYKDGRGTNVDWLNESLKENARYTNAYVNMQGGLNEVAKYNLFMDYMDQVGLFNIPSSSESSRNAGIKRYNLRSNVDLKFFKIFEGKIDLGGRIESYDQPFSNNTYDNAINFWRELTSYPNNIYPVRDPISGQWSGNTLYSNNPVAQLNAVGMYTAHDRTLQGNFSLREDLGFLTEGLYLEQALSFNTWSRVIQNKTATYARYYEGKPATSDQNTPIKFGTNTPYGQLTWKQSNLSAGYNRQFGVHSVHAVFNYYASDMVPDANEDASKIAYHNQQIAGRARYGYQDKYLAELGWSYSGSDSYAPGHRWKFYPAVSLSWVLSEEGFLKNNSVVSHAKFRASVGKSGNDQTLQGRYLYQQYYRFLPGSVTGNTDLSFNGGIGLGRLATPDITAEQSMKYELGLDLTIAKKVDLQANWFSDRRSGIITRNNLVAGYLGYTGVDMLPFQNIGRVSNQGFELGVSYTDRIGDVHVNMGVMGTYAHNKITEQAEISNKNSFSNTTGLAIGTPMGLVADGFYQFEDFNPDGSLIAGVAKPSFGPVQPGDLKYKDLDQNGFVDQSDITKIGRPSYPKLYYSFNLGLSYKGVDVSALFQGASGLDVNLLGAAYNQVVPFVGNTTIYPTAGNAWAYYPTEGIDTRNTATSPRLTTQSNANNYTNSTFWMKNADFLKLRSLQIGYTLPADVSQKFHMEKFRVFLTAVNPFVWSSFYRQYKMDPETPAGYPALQSYNAGISFTF